MHFSNGKKPIDARIEAFIEAVDRLSRGEYDVEIDADSDDALGDLGRRLQRLARNLDRRSRELEILERVTRQINAGVVLEDILDQVYSAFHTVIPFNRIGFSLLTEEDGQTRVRAHWAKTDQREILLGLGYEAPLAGSSLQNIVDTGEPRIINDLEAYYQDHPRSEATALMLKEGIRSSLTCPLIAEGKPIGFMFFSSIHPHIYTPHHTAIFKQIANQLALAVEKGRLVSQLMEQASAIEQHNRELLELNEVKNQFLGMAAHDLRNPLGVIMGGADVLADETSGPFTDDQRHVVGIIQRSSRRMYDLLSELLDVHKIEAGKLALTRERVEIVPLLHEAVSVHRLTALRKAVEVSISQADPVLVYANASGVRQVIDNLLTTAVKFSPRASSVTVSVTRRGNQAYIAIADNGPGILPEERNRLFEAFSRASTRPTNGESSVGLGLAISRHIVESHQGEIGVEGGVGAGSTFWFTLPLVGDPLEHQE